MAKRRPSKPKKRKGAVSRPAKRKAVKRKKPAKRKKLPKKALPKRKPPKRDKKGRFVKQKPRPKPVRRDVSGRIRDSRGRFVAAPKPERHYDGRAPDQERTRFRMTFAEAIAFYEFERQNLPDWVHYLAGAPG